MTPHDELLIRLLPAGKPIGRGMVLILSGRNEEYDETPQRRDLAAKLGAIPVEVIGVNTKDEVAKAVAMADDELTVVTHDYHVPRALLTFVKALERAERERQLRVWVIGVASFLNKWPTEEAKISAYQETGDVASYEDGLAYLAWRDQ